MQRQLLQLARSLPLPLHARVAALAHAIAVAAPRLPKRRQLEQTVPPCQRRPPQMKPPRLSAPRWKSCAWNGVQRWKLRPRARTSRRWPAKLRRSVARRKLAVQAGKRAICGSWKRTPWSLPLRTPVPKRNRSLPVLPRLPLASQARLKALRLPRRLQRRLCRQRRNQARLFPPRETNSRSPRMERLVRRRQAKAQARLLRLPLLCLLHQSPRLRSRINNSRACAVPL